MRLCSLDRGPPSLGDSDQFSREPDQSRLIFAQLLNLSLHVRRPNWRCTLQRAEAVLKVKSEYPPCGFHLNGSDKNFVIKKRFVAVLKLELSDLVERRRERKHGMLSSHLLVRQEFNNRPNRAAAALNKRYPKDEVINSRTLEMFFPAIGLASLLGSKSICGGGISPSAYPDNPSTNGSCPLSEIGGPEELRRQQRIACDRPACDSANQHQPESGRRQFEAGYIDCLSAVHAIQLGVVDVRILARQRRLSHRTQAQLLPRCHGGLRQRGAQSVDSGPVRCAAGLGASSAGSSMTLLTSAETQNSCEMLSPEQCIDDHSSDSHKGADVAALDADDTMEMCRELSLMRVEIEESLSTYSRIHPTEARVLRCVCNVETVIDRVTGPTNGVLDLLDISGGRQTGEGSQRVRASFSFKVMLGPLDEAPGSSSRVDGGKYRAPRFNVSAARAYVMHPAQLDVLPNLPPKFVQHRADMGDPQRKMDSRSRWRRS